MQTRWLLNLVLLLALGALASYFYLRSDNSNTSLSLTSLDPDSINTISIPREQGNIQLHKQAGQWIMQSPYQLPAHEFRIRRLLNILTTSTDKTYPIGDLDLQQFGLNPPRAIIRFDNTEIQFGKTNPVSQNRYVLVNHKLFLLDDELYPLISAQPSSFVDVSPLTKNIRLKKITLPEFSVEKNTQGLWQASIATQNHADRIQHLIENWLSAQAFGVHAYMPREILGQVIIEHEQGTITLDITSHEPWLILARKDAGVEYHFDAGLKDKLLQLPDLTPDNS